MTGCLYVSPRVIPAGDFLGVVPVVLADTLVSWANGGEVKTTPATITQDHLLKVSSVTLGRKVHIVGQAAVAFAGRADLIRECLGTVRDKLPDWEESDRPMRKLGDLANLYVTRGPLEAMGIYVPRSPDQPINSMMRSKPEIIGDLGLTGAIGSGANDLLRLARGFERTVAYMGTQPVHDRIRGFAAAINADRLVHEIVSGSPENSTGGYIEYAMYDYEMQAWVRGPKTLNLFMETADGENGPTTSMVGRAIAYDPGPEIGRVLSVSPGNLTDFQLSDSPHPVTFNLFWKKWRPETVSISFFRRTEHGYSNVTVSTDPWNLDEVTFEVHDDRVEWRISDQYLAELHERQTQQMAMWGGT